MQKIKLFSIFVSILFSLSLLNVQANEVTKWTALTLQAIRINKTNPPVASRNLAMLEAGMFDAINSIVKKYQPYAMLIEATSDLPIEVAAAQSAHDLLSKLYPNSTPNWDEQLNLTLNSYPDSSRKQDAINLGSRIAANIWDLRRNDLKTSFIDQVFSPIDSEPGVWIQTPPAYAPPLLPLWGQTKTFGILSGDQFRQDGPPKLYSAEYAHDYIETKEYGSKDSTTRSPEQTQIALFWADNAGSVTPPGHWNRIALDIISKKNLDIIESSRLMTLLNIALADAAISAWDMKYTYNCWRPITAAKEASRDDNPETQSDINWVPFIVTPPFPEYVSGHSTFSAAAATVLGLYFGSDKMNFSTESEGAPGVIRSYTRFSEAADEAGKSRIYGGIHYEFSNRDGKKAGNKIAEFVFKNLLLKK